MCTIAKGGESHVPRALCRGDCADSCASDLGPLMSFLRRAMMCPITHSRGAPWEAGPRALSEASAGSGTGLVRSVACLRALWSLHGPLGLPFGTPLQGMFLGCG